MNQIKSFLIRPVNRFVLSVALIGALFGTAACSTQSPSETLDAPVAGPTASADQATVKPAATQTTAPASSPTPLPASAEPPAPLPPPQLEPTTAPTATLTASPSPMPSATPIPTSSVVAGWLSYENEYFGYRFAYPPDARIRTQGVTGFPNEELPENMTDEAYREQLEERYPDDLCVTVLYEDGFVVFAPAYEKEGQYTVPCGVTGIGDYVLTDITETVVIDDISLTTTAGVQMRGKDGAWRGEFLRLPISDDIYIDYGSMEGTEVRDVPEERYFILKETLLEIVTSFRQIE